MTDTINCCDTLFIDILSDDYSIDYYLLLLLFVVCLLWNVVVLLTLIIGIILFIVDWLTDSNVNDLLLLYYWMTSNIEVLKALYCVFYCCVLTNSVFYWW